MVSHQATLHKTSYPLSFRLLFSCTVVVAKPKGRHKKTGILPFRLTVKVDPLPPNTVRALYFFQNKLTYFDLFFHFIMGKIGPKCSHLIMVRAEGADLPLTVSMTVKRLSFFLTTSLKHKWIYLCAEFQLYQTPSGFFANRYHMFLQILGWNIF